MHFAQDDTNNIMEMENVEVPAKFKALVKVLNKCLYLTLQNS